MKKKRCLWLFAVLLVMSLAVSGCSSDDTSETSATDSTEEESSDSSSASSSSGTPDYSAGLDDDGNLEGIDAASLVTLPDYKNAVLSQSDVEVTDDDVQAEIDLILEEFAETSEVTDRAVEDGDTVNIDYVGSIDGEEFDGGSTEGAGTDVTIGVTSYIDDFLEQLIGHTPGETFDVEVTFPDPYENNTDLSGKDAVFEVTINYITETTLPELTDDFVAENLADSYDSTTVEEFEATVRGELETNSQYDAVWDYLIENTTFSEVPESLVEELLQISVDYYTQQASYYSLDLEEYLSYYGIESEEALREELWDTTETTAKWYIIAQAIAEAEGIETDDAALEAFFGDTDYSTYLEYYGTGYVKMQVRIHDVATLIYETATLE
ncbi:MAG: trigger factor [Lachnospiraceae bacterium]|nr:trigger factor [Lachnospiraceae bacterium]